MSQQEVYQTTKVFTPTTPARLTFVERDAINDRLVSALSTPGKQVVVYGHSGSGKTTLLMNKLHQLYEGEVITRCVAGMSFEQAVCDAFEQLSPVYVAEQRSAKKGSTVASLSAEYASIKAQISSDRGHSDELTKRPLLPPQLTPQTLARLMGAANRCWVLEDFHKMAPLEKTKLAQVMKVFMDVADEFSQLRIVALGAVGTARQVVSYDPEMRNRVAEIFVPLMTRSELHQVIAKGEELLNVSFSPRVVAGIVGYSNGLASVCHQLALNMCQSADVVETCASKVHLDEAELKKAVQVYLDEASDTLKSVFDRAFRIKRRGKYDNTRLIIGAVLEGGEDGSSHYEILARIRKTEPIYPPGNLNHFLGELQGDDRGSVLRYDEQSGKYFFADPIYQAYATLLLKPSTGVKVWESTMSNWRVEAKDLSAVILSSITTFTISWPPKNHEDTTDG